MRLLCRLTACRPLRNARGTRLRTNRLQNSRTGLFCLTPAAPLGFKSPFLSTNEQKSGIQKGYRILFGGERGNCTLAAVAHPTPLAGAPLRPLEYFSVLAEVSFNFAI